MRKDVATLNPQKDILAHWHVNPDSLFFSHTLTPCLRDLASKTRLAEVDAASGRDNHR